jgi:hypothetical protein
MWIVQFALRRPYTFRYGRADRHNRRSGGLRGAHRHIFPYINIPVVSVVWSSTGISPDEMEKRIVTVSERAMTTTVNDVEHIESQSY